MIDKEITTKPKVPTILELTGDVDVAKKESDMQVLLNQKPPKKWIENNNDGNSKGIPIGKLEFLLTNIFTKWRVEILREILIANSVVVTVRVHVKNPITGEWDWNDGIGASALKTDTGARAMDFTKLKTNSVMTGAPAAKSFAFKNAVKSFGVVFGRDLNRDDVQNYDGLSKKYEEADLSEFKKVI